MARDIHFFSGYRVFGLEEVVDRDSQIQRIYPQKCGWAHPAKSGGWWQPLSLSRCPHPKSSVPLVDLSERNRHHPSKSHLVVRHRPERAGRRWPEHAGLRRPEQAGRRRPEHAGRRRPGQGIWRASSYGQISPWWPESQQRGGFSHALHSMLYFTSKEILSSRQ
jgi:hypothetical protein